MAELGIVAAALQIAQLAGAVALKTNSIYYKLEDAPRVVKSHLHSVRNFTFMLNALKSALESASVDQPCIRDILSAESRTSITQLLQYCNEEAISCNEILQSIEPQDEHKLKGAWKKLLSIKMGEEIEQRLKKLDSLQSQLSLWYSHQLMLLTCRVDLRVTNIDSRLLSLQQEVLSSLSTREPSVLPIEKMFNQMSNHIASRPSILADLARNNFQRRKPEHLLCRCRQMLRHTIDMSCVSIRYQHRSTMGHQPGCAYFGQTLAKRMETTLRFSLASRSIEIHLARPQHLGNMMLFGLSLIPIVDELTAPSFKRFRDAHLQISEVLSTDFQDPPCPSRDPITEQSLSNVKQAMQELQNGLIEDLQTNQYSARDQSKYGSTLLHAYAQILVVVWHFQNELQDLIEGTVGLLVYYGASANAMMPVPNSYSSCGQQTLQTALSLSLNHLKPIDVLRLGPKASIPHIFLQHEMDAFSGQEFYDFRKVGLFAKTPELAIEYGCSQLSVAIVQRQQCEVERLIRNRHNVNDTVSPPYSPLCFAVGWSAGANILLNNAADPSAAVHCAIVYEDEATLRILLDRGSRLNAQVPPSFQDQGFWSCNEFAYSVFSFGLWRQRVQNTSSSAIIALIVQALAASRQELMDLAKRCNSVLELKRCDWKDPSKKILVSDTIAMALTKSLLEKEVRLPPALWPSNRKSVYHDGWMTALAANHLFLAGFKEVDLLSDLNRTPLLINAHFTRSDIVERSTCLYWFLNHGPVRVVFPELNGCSLAHVLAANLGEEWHLEPPKGLRFEAKHNTDLIVKARACLPAVLDQVFSLVTPSQTDECKCFCSSAGCLPVHALLKHMGIRYRDREWPRHFWSTWKDEQEVLDLWSQCSTTNPGKHSERSEICRLQIFDRLSMRHTCCTFIIGGLLNSWNNRYFSPTIQTMDDSERAQFQQEDAYSEFQLEAFMKLYNELSTKYQHQPEVFWETWWTVLEEYVPSVNWAPGIRHTQVHDDVLPIEEDELDTKIDQIRERITGTLAAISEIQEGVE